MQILFITLIDIRTISASGIYSDLVRKFAREGHSVVLVSPFEKRNPCGETIISEEDSSFPNNPVTIIKVPIGNTQKTGAIEKGISTVLLERQVMQAIKRHTSSMKFDLVLYSTPPITLVKPIEYIKHRDGSFTYLLLKDIFPQNAIDIGMLTKTGVKGLLYRWFKKKEQKLYKISDCIGCMSPENANYILRNNIFLNSNKVEVCPNSIEYSEMIPVDKSNIRNKFNIPIYDKVFIYGGNLGKAQGVPFIVECIKEFALLKDVFLIIAGSGTEYKLISDYINNNKPSNVRLIETLPREEYEELVAACDVGLIFLDYRFTIPNFPSRLLSYLQNSLPVIAATDRATDIGDIIEGNGFGWKCNSNDVEGFIGIIEEAKEAKLTGMGAKGYAFLLENYLVEHTYSTICNSVEKTRK